jgi:hypothetical protein
MQKRLETEQSADEIMNSGLAGSSLPDSDKTRPLVINRELQMPFSDYRVNQ